MQRIIVATDGSPGANRAIDTAARIAKATGYELIILTIGGNISGAELRRLTFQISYRSVASLHSPAMSKFGDNLVCRVLLPHDAE
jgi:nucleotide-binding universal stress UspA family protein